MKTAIFETARWEKEHFSRILKDDNISYFDEPLNESNGGSAKGIELAVIFLHSKISQKVLKKMPKLKYVITRSVGYDHIDMRACKKRKISVFNVPDYGAQTVAEHTFALILALTRNIQQAVNSTKLGSFSLSGLEGTDISGKTIGVIGPGKIGLEVIKRAKSFDMKIIAYSDHEHPETAKSLGFEFVSLQNLLKKSDIITIHSPLTEKTKHLINKQNINQIKPGAMLINTARGGIVESAALLEALERGIIAKAALDVLEGEMEIEEENEILRRGISKTEAELLATDYALMKNPKVIITPHIAFYTREALERIIKKTCSLIEQCKKKDLSGAL